MGTLHPSLRAIMVMLATPACAHAHAGATARVGSGDALTLLVLALAAVAYAMRVRTLWRHPRGARAVPPWRIACFTLALAALGSALTGPLDALATASFSAHMAQHMLLMAVAAPLLALGAPMVPLLRSSPRLIRRWLLGGLAPLTRPFVAFLLHGFTVWFWHAPGPYETALASTPVHMFEHVTFLGTGLLFWHSLLQEGRRAAGQGAGAFWSLATMMHSGLLGALLTFATAPLYPSYRHASPLGWTALEDQQLAGLIMWIPAGLVYLAGGIYSMAAWLRAVEAGTGKARRPGAAGNPAAGTAIKR